jgi:small subunit ribosomal protein S21
MILIPVKDGETLEKALRKYKKKYERTGVLKEIRGRAFFTKPSVALREVKKKAIRRQAHYASENF